MRLAEVNAEALTSVDLLDRLPDGATYVEGSTRGGITTEPVVDTSANSLRWSVTAIPTGAEVLEFQYDVRVDIASAEGTALTNTMDLIAPGLAEPIRDTASVLVVKPEVFGISPTRGGADGTVLLQLEGRHLSGDSAVRLERNGQILAAASVAAVDDSRLLASFELSGAPAGTWDVIVTPLGGESLVLAQAFAIDSSNDTDVRLDIIGLESVRLNAVSRYWIEISNEGNHDVYGAAASVTVPKTAQPRLLGTNQILVDALVETLGQQGAPETVIQELTNVNWGELPQGHEIGDRIQIGLFLPVLPAGSKTTHVLEVQPTGDFELEGEVGVPRYDFVRTGEGEHWIGSPPVTELTNQITSEVAQQGLLAECQDPTSPGCAAIQGAIREKMNEIMKDYFVFMGKNVLALLVALKGKALPPIPTSWGEAFWTGLCGLESPYVV